jgi:thioredoxin reductase (NADPH)
MSASRRARGDEASQLGKDTIVTTAVIVGDGPAGLSAALFLAKNGIRTVVYGQDATAMHYAHLHNYLGVEDLGGSDFQVVARRQAAIQGADLRDAEVTAIVARDGAEGFVVRAGDEQEAADYVVLAGGKQAQALAASLGAERDGGRIPVDGEQRTLVDRLYAVGRVVRPERSQAIVSAGAGAVAALDILSREAGKDVHDWDTPAD